MDTSEHKTGMSNCSCRKIENAPAVTLHNLPIQKWISQILPHLRHGGATKLCSEAVSSGIGLNNPDATWQRAYFGKRADGSTH